MRRAGAVLAGLVLLLGLVTPVAAHDPSDELEEVRSEIEQLNQRISEARAESREVAVELSAAEERLAAAQAELTAAEAKVDAIRAEIATHEERHQQLTAQIATVETQLVETQNELRGTRQQLESQAVAMYMNASASLSPVMLTFDTASDVAVGLVYAGGVADRSEDLVATLQFLEAEEERQRAALEENRAEVEEVLATLDREREVLEAEAAQVEALRAEAEAELVAVQGLLARIQSQIAAAEQHKDGLEADAARLEREITARQQAQGEKPGILAMPAAGRISSPFGYRIHPIFGTRRLHTGIDISAPYGAPISAAGGGVVILAGPYGGYGNAVVIDHGGGLATLYAHQSRIAVSQGQTVATGDTVGYIGCTGYCTGPHLHFETREGGRPVDPMRYLRG